MPVKAGQSEIIQAHIKDDEYKSFLRNWFGELFRDLTGTQSWIKRREELELFADIFYFGTTTLCGYQTLGEEYCSLIQVDQTGWNIPTLWSRSLMIFSQILVPYLSKKLLRKLELALQSEALDSDPKLKNIILALLPLLKQLINVFQRLHLMTFYFSSIYYQVAKRLTGIHYVLARGVQRNEYYNLTYRVLGLVTLMHLVVSLIQLLQQTREAFPKIKDILNGKAEHREKIEHSTEQGIATHFKCTLCLEKLHDITATPCGHLFCWYCINEWCRNKAECPLCREDLLTQQLVYLHYFHPT